jgi:hypothetical protein
MNIWREIKNGCIYWLMYIFNVYVDIYLWVSKQDLILSLLQSNPTSFEPESQEWISICSLYYSKNYKLCITYIDMPFDLTKEYVDFYNTKNSYKIMDQKNQYIGFGENLFEIKEHLFLAKKANAYISRTYFTGYKPSLYTPFICIENKSDIVFTYVEYIHPNMRNTIELNIPDEFWIVGNELFTPAFVLRMLEHQCEKYIFDLKYKLHIVDQNIHDLFLNSDNYILVEKKEYSILRI